MIDLEITATLTGEPPFTVRPNMGTILALERHYSLDSGITAIQSMKIEYLTWLAWEKRRHDGHTVPTFKDFMDRLEDLEFETDDAPLAETEPATE